MYRLGLHFAVRRTSHLDPPPAAPAAPGRDSRRSNDPRRGSLLASTPTYSDLAWDYRRSTPEPPPLGVRHPSSAVHTLARGFASSSLRTAQRRLRRLRSGDCDINERGEILRTNKAWKSAIKFPTSAYPIRTASRSA